MFEINYQPNFKKEKNIEKDIAGIHLSLKKKH